MCPLKTGFTVHAYNYIPTLCKRVVNLLMRLCERACSFEPSKSPMRHVTNKKLEDLKVLRRSPDHLKIVKIVQGQLQLIMEQLLFYHIWELQPFWSGDLNNLMNNPSNSSVISEFCLFDLIFYVPSTIFQL